MSEGFPVGRQGLAKILKKQTNRVVKAISRKSLKELDGHNALGDSLFPSQFT